jgi:hypothetical protein
MAHDDSEAAVAEAEPGPVPAAKAPDLGLLPTGTPPLEPMAQREPLPNPPPELSRCPRGSWISRPRSETRQNELRFLLV